MKSLNPLYTTAISLFIDVECEYRLWWGLSSFIYHYGGGRFCFPYSDTKNPYIRLYTNVITSLYGQ